MVQFSVNKKWSQFCAKEHPDSISVCLIMWLPSSCIKWWIVPDFVIKRGSQIWKLNLPSSPYIHMVYYSRNSSLHSLLRLRVMLAEKKRIWNIFLKIFGWLLVQHPWKVVEHPVQHPANMTVAVMPKLAYRQMYYSSIARLRAHRFCEQGQELYYYDPTAMIFFCTDTSQSLLLISSKILGYFKMTTGADKNVTK